MNYLKQIRGFWRSHEEHLFTCTEVALYFHLVEVCNICGWKNPFKRNNSKIGADLRISINTLKNARNKLAQCGLISFKTQNGSPNVAYTLSKFDEVGSEVTIEVGSEVGSEVTIEVLPTKDKLNQTKPNQTKKSKSHSEVETSVLEKIENLDFKKSESKNPKGAPAQNPIYSAMVSVWFKFYSEKFKVKPEFKSFQGTKIKSIQEKLKSKSEEFQTEWTAEVATEAFRQFLEIAYSDKWLSDHFELQNLDSQFNSITAKALKKNGINQTTVASILDQW